MVRYTVALLTEGNSSMSASTVKPPCFCSKSLTIVFLGAVALWPRLSSTAIRFVAWYLKCFNDS